MILNASTYNLLNATKFKALASLRPYYSNTSRVYEVSWLNSPDRAGILPTAGRQIKAMAGTTIAKMRLPFATLPLS